MASRKPSSTQNSPNLPLQQDWHRMPLEERYAPLSHKEKLAILTMEQIPEILRDANLLEIKKPISPTLYFSPSQLPLQDRMVMIFSRVLAHARMEADNGEWNLDIASGADTKSTSAEPTTVKKGIQPGDVMSSTEAEEFLANVEVVHLEVNGVTVWLRRYYRVVKSGEKRKEGIGAGRATVGKTLPSFVMPSIGQRMKKHEDDERVLVAEVELGVDGIAVGGWWNDKFHHHEEEESAGAVSSRRTGKWAPIPLRPFVEKRSL